MILCSRIITGSLSWLPTFFLFCFIPVESNQDLKQKTEFTNHQIPHPRITQNRRIILDDGLFVFENPPEGTLNTARAPFASFGQPWPLPKLYESKSEIFRLNLNAMKFKQNHKKHDLIQKAFGRLKQILSNPHRVSDYPDYWKHQEDQLDAMAESTIKILSVSLSPFAKQANWPHKEMNEMYVLTVNKTGVFISAEEVWGALRGLETFKQMIWAPQSGKMFINRTVVDDEPRFQHRGLLIDTARNFITKTTIFKMLDAMSMNKMNVFHWHIVDDQSFPYQSEIFPNLSAKGSFKADVAVYSIRDVKEIIEYARLRGIRVIPEFDTPGHSRSWGFGYPDLLTPCYSDYKNSGFIGLMNPARNTTYQFLSQFFSELISVFKDEFLHLGGDEVDPICWANNPEVQTLMKTLGIEEINDVTDYYFQKLQNLISKAALSQKKKRHFIVWEEIFAGNALLKKGTTVHVWKSGKYQLKDIANQSFDIVFSSCWYVDRITYGSHWVSFYECDPTFKVEDEAFVSKVIGGEACVWTEYMSDMTVLSRTWPLASATAERLWSPMSVSSPLEAAPRLEEQRCRMIKNGIPNGIASGPGLCTAELSPPSPSVRWNESLSIDAAPEVLLNREEIMNERKKLLPKYKFVVKLKNNDRKLNEFDSYYTKLKMKTSSYSLSVTYIALLIVCILIALVLLAAVTKCARVSVMRDLRKLPRRVRLFLSSLIPVFLFAVGLLAWGLNGLLFSIYSFPPNHI